MMKSGRLVPHIRKEPDTAMAPGSWLSLERVTGLEPANVSLGS